MSRPHPLARRPLLLGLSGLSLAALPRVGHAASPVTERSFKVYRKGRDIGRVQLLLRSENGGLAVGTRWSIAVKVAFVTVYRYSQTADDRWQNDRLVASAVRTNDNGNVTAVTISKAGEGLLVEGPAGRISLSADALTDGCFWNRRITQVTALIDSQHGDYVPTQVSGPVAEAVPVGGRPVMAERFTFVSTPAKDGSARGGRVWYDANDRWIRSEIDTRGERLLLEADA